MALNMQFFASFPGWSDDDQMNQFMSYLSGGLSVTPVSGGFPVAKPDLDSWTREQLKAKAKELKVKGITGMKKPELVEAIKTAMCSPRTVVTKPTTTKKDREIKKVRSGRELLAEFPDPRANIFNMSETGEIPDDFSFRKAQVLCRLMGINCHKMNRDDMIKAMKEKFDEDPDLIVEAPVEPTPSKSVPVPDEVEKPSVSAPAPAPVLDEEKPSVPASAPVTDEAEDEKTPIHTPPVKTVEVTKQKRPRQVGKTTKHPSQTGQGGIKQILSETTQSFAELPNKNFASLIAEAAASSGDDSD